MEHPIMSDGTTPRSDRIIGGTLTRAGRFLPAGLVAAMTVALTAARAYGFAREGRPFDLALLAELGLGLVVGLGVAATLYALSALAETTRTLRACVGELERLSAETRAAAGERGHGTSSRKCEGSGDVRGERDEAAAAVRAACDEMLVILRDVRENSLLSEEERRAKAGRVEQQELTEAAARIEKLTADGDFARAGQVLDECAQRYPGRAALTAMGGKITERRQQRMEADVREFSRRIDDFINISAWERARGVAAELRERYPALPAVAQLEARIEREYQLYEDAQCRQTYAEIQRYVSRRRWSEALAAAETFIERFPHRSEAEALQLQLPTLANNADVSARQEMDAEITELAKRGQYAEAEVLADRLIRRWPDSPQAEVLRSQLARLHELATNPNAPPPRVRPGGAT
jgi:outer membrane protein assembly factor BamD (BamD/ComL family)